ncbi:MAG: signal recognition particle receptor subunit alpha, partial [Streptosporangiaceae bacterium]
MEEALIIAGIVIVAGGGGGAGIVSLLRARRLSSSSPPAELEGPAGTATAAPPAAGTVSDLDIAAITPPDLSVAAELLEPPADLVERPPPSAGRLARLRGRLARSQSGFGSALLSLLSRATLDDQAWEEIEDTLISADMGVAPAQQLVERLRTEVKVTGTRDPAQVRALLRADLLAQLGPGMERTLHTSRHGDRPAVVLVVGVNGTGKTTACGRLARALIGDGQTVLLGAADTFRAAAADQLQTWGRRTGAKVVRSDREGADPASVAFEAVQTG